MLERHLSLALAYGGSSTRCRVRGSITSVSKMPICCIDCYLQVGMKWLTDGIERCPSLLRLLHQNRNIVACLVGRASGLHHHQPPR